MGKRELLLISLFVVIGIVVYQFTAPPPPPGSEGVTFGGIVGKLKREIQGSRETATASAKQAMPVEVGTRLVRINFQANNDFPSRHERQGLGVEDGDGRGYSQAERRPPPTSPRSPIERVGIRCREAWS